MLVKILFNSSLPYGKSKIAIVPKAATASEASCDKVQTT